MSNIKVMTTVLIVDDRPINREVLSLLLLENDYKVLEAEDGLHALEIVRGRSEAVDLIISDIAMPKMDGISLAKALQEDQFLSGIPIIFYTGTYRAAEAYRLTEGSNVKHVLTKPCDIEIILGTIEGVLDLESHFFNPKKLTVQHNKPKELPLISDLEKSKKDLENIHLRLTSLIEMGLDMSSEKDIDKLVYRLCKGGKQFLDASHGGTLLRDANDHSKYKYYKISENNTLETRFIDAEDFPKPLQEIFLNHKILCIHAPIIDMSIMGYKDLSLPLSSLLTLPIRTSKTEYGQIFFINKKNRRMFTPGDQRYLMTLVDKFSIIYENLILYQAQEKLHLYRRQMAEIVRANSLGEMASSLAHEINQPLAAISSFINGCLRRLKDKNEVTPEIMEMLSHASKESERAGEMIHRIKNFVRKGELFCETIDINSLVEESLELLSQEFKSSAIEFNFNRNSELPLVEVDKIQIQQVLLNIIRNSIEAISSNDISLPKISIKIQPVRETRLMIIIEDNGPGFSEQAKEHLFEVYFSTKVQGMGLGLAISRSIIEAHSGQLTASERPFGGACFQFDLPIKNSNRKTLTQKVALHLH